MHRREGGADRSSILTGYSPCPARGGLQYFFRGRLACAGVDVASWSLAKALEHEERSKERVRVTGVTMAMYRTECVLGLQFCSNGIFCCTVAV